VKVFKEALGRSRSYQILLLRSLQLQLSGPPVLLHIKGSIAIRLAASACFKFTETRTTLSDLMVTSCRSPQFYRNRKNIQTDATAIIASPQAVG